MAIDRLSSTSALISALRGDMLRKTDKRSPASSTAQTTESARNSDESPKSTAKLRTQLVDIAREVDLDDPTSLHNSRIRLVRSVLLWEYGEAFREHPDWKPLLDHITSALDADDAQKQKYMDLLKALKANKHR
nr:hypothetical protein [uncultured Pseudoxanthomonas sp.]